MILNPFDRTNNVKDKRKKTRNKQTQTISKKNGCVTKSTQTENILPVSSHKRAVSNKTPHKTNRRKKSKIDFEKIFSDSDKNNTKHKGIGFKTIEFKNRLEVDAVINFKYPTPELDPLLPKAPFLMNYVAPRNSGKTNNLVKFLTDPEFCLRKFHYIIIWSPTFNIDPTWIPFKDTYEEDEEYKQFDTYDPDEVNEIIETIKANKMKQPDRHYLFIFDDMGDQNICMPHTIGPVEAIAIKGRHYNISAIYVAQKRTLFSRAIRENTTNFIIFALNNANEIQALCDELRGPTMSVNEFMEIYSYCTHEKHTFMHVDNYSDDKNLKFRKNWNVVIDTNKNHIDVKI